MASKPVILDEVRRQASATATRGVPSTRSGNRRRRPPPVARSCSRAARRSRLYRLDEIRRQRARLRRADPPDLRGRPLRGALRARPRRPAGRRAPRRAVPLSDPPHAATRRCSARGATRAGTAPCFEHGYLDLIARAKAAHGERARVAPERADLRAVLLPRRGRRAQLAGPSHRPTCGRRSTNGSATVARELDPALVHAFDLRPFRPASRTCWSTASATSPGTLRSASDRVDTRDGAQRLAYQLRGPAPARRSRSMAGRCRRLAKTRRSRSSGGRCSIERLLAPDGGTLEAAVDGDVLPIGRGPGRDRGHGPIGRPRSAPRIGARNRAAVYAPGRRWRRQAGDRERPARLGRASRRSAPGTADAWVLMDGVREARRQRRAPVRVPPAAAVLTSTRGSSSRRGTPDWDRLRRSDGARVVAHGSFRWKVLMLRVCLAPRVAHRPGDHLAAARSHGVITTPGWRFGDLGHGVIKDDLSRQMNPRSASTCWRSARRPSSRRSSPTGRAIGSTRQGGPPDGHARFDRLLEVGRAVPEAERDLVLVAPTWRAPGCLFRAPPADGDGHCSTAPGSRTGCQAWMRPAGCSRDRRPLRRHEGCTSASFRTPRWSRSSAGWRLPPNVTRDHPRGDRPATACTPAAPCS